MNDEIKFIAKRAELEYVLLKAWYMVEDSSIDFSHWLEDTANGDYGSFWEQEASDLIVMYSKS